MVIGLFAVSHCGFGMLFGLIVVICIVVMGGFEVVVGGSRMVGGGLVMGFGRGVGRGVFGGQRHHSFSWDGGGDAGGRLVMS